jgi:long-chain acyl-CoA synthetase
VNLADIVGGHDGTQLAIVTADARTTYAELEAAVGQARGGLRALGLGAGDRVALVCSNGLPFVVSYLAVLGIGAVAVPLNPASPGAELTRELSAVAATAAIVDPTATAWSDVDRAALASLGTVIAVGDAPIDASATYAELLAADPVERADVEADDVAVLMFTSGTAGAPRAAMLTHASLLANLEQARATNATLGPGDVMYGVIPLFHIFGLNVVLASALRSGATLVLAARFDAAAALATIGAEGVTVLPGVPTMWVAFAELADPPADAFATVRLAYSGAARLPIPTMQRIADRFGVTVAEGYGLTEASPIVTSSSGLAPRAGSVGAVLDGVELRVVDERGGDVLVGDAGEIWVRGDNVFKGYLDDPEATARVLTADGWLRTGDIGYCDDDGRLYLVDRAKDLVIVSGFNVFPAEVEEVLAEHAGVADVGVVGVPHPQTGEAVRAYVVVEPGATLDADELIAFARDRLARYKCPSSIVFVDELPRNAAGKLVRRQLTMRA